MTREIRNAKIDSTMLGFEDHGIMTAFLYTMSDGLGQGFGGYSMNGEWGMEFIKMLLKALGVDSWEKLTGTHCRIDASNDKIHRIGHIIENKWFEPAVDLKPFELRKREALG